MKKLLTALTISAILAISSSAMPGGVKVPKTLCLAWAGQADVHQLAFKASGTIYNAGKKIKTYTITGRDHFGVISGSGHVLPGTTLLQATYSGMSDLDNRQIRSYELGFNLETLTGLIEGRVDYTDGTIFGVVTDVNITDCSQLNIIVSSDEIASDWTAGF